MRNPKLRRTAARNATRSLPSNNLQNAAAFLAAGGQKGLQIPVLRSGNYAINPWFAANEQVPMKA
jgi:hypothetical protein